MSLKEKVEQLIQKAKIANLTMKWMERSIWWNTAEDNPTIDDTYDFVNLYGFDFKDSNFMLSGMESSYIDNFTTEINSRSGLLGAPFLTKVIAPNVIVVGNLSFGDCTSLKHCEVGKLQEMRNTSFRNCSLLETFKVKPGITSDLYLQYSPNLTVESLEGIVDNYADMTGQTSPIFYIGETNIAKLSEEYIQKLINKGITYK